ncbi:MAG: response regulator transcription factor [Treponema sp.]|nr:response regulator transcription factor [Treponema sp.]
MKNIFIIEDHPIVMDSLNSYFSNTGSWNVIETASSLASAKKKIPSLKTGIDILILDIQLEDGWGLDIIRWLKEQNIKQPLVAVYTAFDDYGHVSAALSLGVKAYITKNRDKQDLEKAILSALSGIISIDETAQMKLNTITSVTSMLTKREAEIFTLVKTGLSNKEIALKLSISVRTVGNILCCVYDKTGIKSRQELERL